MAALGNLPPDLEPRATDHVAEMVALVETLIARGHAYAAEGHVLFAVDSYAEYGALSGRTTDDMIAGARVEVAPYKRDPMDFVLWKPSGRRRASMGQPLGPGAAGLAPGMLRHEPGALGRRRRRPRRRQRPDLPAPRERDRAIPLRPPGRALRAGLAAQRDAAGRGPQDVQVAGQLPDGPRPPGPRRAGRGDPLRVPVDALLQADGLDGVQGAGRGGGATALVGDGGAGRDRRRRRAGRAARRSEHPAGPGGAASPGQGGRRGGAGGVGRDAGAAGRRHGRLGRVRGWQRGRARPRRPPGGTGRQGLGAGGCAARRAGGGWRRGDGRQGQRLGGRARGSTPRSWKAWRDAAW